MKNPSQSKIPSYKETNFIESKSISFVENILTSHGRVMPHLTVQDRRPNIDGELVVHDQNGDFVGRLKTQVRTLRTKHNFKYRCPVHFINYCKKAVLPVIFLGVDNKNKKIYWIHFDKQFIRELNYKQNKCSITIKLDPKRFIDKNTKNYIQEWETIAKSHQEKIEGYGKLKEDYEKLAQKANPALGMTKDEFKSIHIFLDEFNRLLDNEFKIVKSRFYPDAWKVGLAYYQYTNSNVSYILYPIPQNENDVQIKEISEPLDSYMKKGLEFTLYAIENPIQIKPIEYARKVIQTKVLKLLENKFLDHRGNEFLVREFIFAFIDRFYVQLGLEAKDKYSLVEIAKAFFEYLPLWTMEALNLMAKKLPQFRLRRLISPIYIDPDNLGFFISEDERKQIDEEVKSKLANKNVVRIPFYIDNDKLPFRIFFELFPYLEKREIKEIKRVYLAKDYSRLKYGRLVWNLFSLRAFEENLKIFFSNLPKVYEDLVSQNFPLLKNELPLSQRTNRMVVVFDIKDTYRSFQDAPRYEMFYLFDDEVKNKEFNIEVYSKEEKPNLEKFDLFQSKYIEIEGIKYRVNSWTKGMLDFIFDELPMLNYVYKILEDNLKKYFEKI